MARTWRLVGTLAVVLAPALVFGCQGDAAESRLEVCTRVRDHLVTLEVERREGSQDEVAKHRHRVRASLGDAFIERCVRAASDSYIECVLAARSPDVAARCK
jgi:hypothetical protein